MALPKKRGSTKTKSSTPKKKTTRSKKSTDDVGVDSDKQIVSVTAWKEGRRKAVKSGEARREALQTSTFVSAKDGEFSIGDEVLDDELDVIILNYGFSQSRYEDGSYDPSNPSSPYCYAHGLDPDELAPHESAPDPQADSCADCEWSKWGSAAKGRGKACTERRLIAFIFAESKDREIMMMNVPSPSIKAWKKYLGKAEAKFELPPELLHTTISFSDTKDNYGKRTLSFEPIAEIEDEELLQFIMDHQNDATQMIVTPPDYEAMEKAREESSPKAKSKGKGKKKKRKFSN